MVAKALLNSLLLDLGIGRGKKELCLHASKTYRSLQQNKVYF